MKEKALAKAQTPARDNHLQTQSGRSSSARHPLLNLQRSVGNQAFQRLIRSPYIQTKLQVSTPGDPYEQEADRVADTVMRMPDPKATAGETTRIQAKPLATRITRLVEQEPEQPTEEEKEETIATKPVVQRAPLAVREDDEEEKLATKLDTGLLRQEDEEEKTVATKLATDAPLQRQAREDDEREEETLRTSPIQRQTEEEEEEKVQTKSLSSQLSPSLRIHPVHRSASAVIQRLCTECEEEKEQSEGQSGNMVHRKSAPEQSPDDDDVEEQQVQPKVAQNAAPKVTTSVAANIHAMNGGGSPLSEATRSFFEPRFGAGFSQVRLHTDSQAAETARSINAKAFTVGRNIAFGSGQYAPHSHEGRQLLAHELTHVVQQSASDRYRVGQSEFRAGEYAPQDIGGRASLAHQLPHIVHRQPEGVIFRRPTAEERQAQKRDAWLKELGNYPPEAHQEWKGLTNMEKVAVVIQMTKRYGYDFAKSFLSYTKGPNKSSIQHFGPGFPEHTPDWFQARGYRLWQRSSFNEFWVHPSGSMIMQILDQKTRPQTAEDRPPREPPVEDCSGVADATLSILRDTISTETSVKEDLEGTKARLEKMNKSTDDYCKQYDEYIGSLKAMKARVDSTVDDIDTMRQQMVEDKCSVSNIDGLLQDLTDLQIWADIESSPMSTQFLECFKIRRPMESTEEE